MWIAAFAGISTSCSSAQRSGPSAPQRPTLLPNAIRAPPTDGSGDNVTLGNDEPFASSGYSASACAARRPSMLAASDTSHVGTCETGTGSTLYTSANEVTVGAICAGSA